MLETGWCTQYFRAGQHRVRLILGATLITQMMLFWVLTPFQRNMLSYIFRVMKLYPVRHHESLRIYMSMTIP
jgi:hypothetical protein